MLNSVYPSCSAAAGSSDGPFSQKRSLWASSLFSFSFFSLLPADTNTQFHNCGQFQLNFIHIGSGGWQQIFSGVQNPYKNFCLK